MRCHCRQLTTGDGAVIESLLADGLYLRAIGARLGVSASTICRERRRGLDPGLDRCLAVVAQRAFWGAPVHAGQARRRLGTDASSSYWSTVLPLLKLGWSPHQIAGRLRRMPDAPSISHVTIHAAIYAMPRGALRTELVHTLRESHAGRLPRARGSSRFTGVQNMTPIGLRPPEVDQRRASGHWEADLIKSSRNGSAVGTPIKRTSRYIMLTKLDGFDAQYVLEGFTKRLRSVPISLRKTLTYDQGTKMALHENQPGDSRVFRHYVVADSEVELSAIRSQGPGGQHVNKTSTAVHLRFDISASGLPLEVKQRMLASSDTRISSEGVLVIKAQGTRSLESNKAEAMSRLHELIEEAFHVPKRRKPTKPTFGSRQRRLEGKSQRSVVKSGRGKVDV
jgi:ribosome-associated protein